VTFRVVLSPAASRELRKLSQPAAQRVVAVFEVLAQTPRPPAAKPLVGRPGLWRVRSGDYRILYEINDDVLLVFVVRVGHRREVYDR